MKRPLPLTPKTRHCGITDERVPLLDKPAVPPKRNTTRIRTSFDLLILCNHLLNCAEQERVPALPCQQRQPDRYAVNVSEGQSYLR